VRVLFVAPQMTTGGAERMVADLGRGLMERGHEVGVASSGGHFAEELRDAGAEVHYLPWLAARRPIGLGRAVLDLANVLRGERYDLIDAQSYITSMVAFLAIRIARQRTRHVYTLHLIEQPKAYWLMGKTLGWTTDGIITVSESNKVRLVAEGIRDSKIRVVHNGVDLSAFRKAPKRRGPGPLRLGIVARLIERKRHANLLRAIARLVSERGPGAATLDVIGDGPEEGRLKALSGELGIADEVRFLGDRGDVPDLLRELDAFVLPSSYEGFPISIIEAMASGLPVVATAVDGVPEVVEHERTGLLVRTGDVQGLAGALARLADDSQLRQRLGEQAYTTVRERFSLAAMTDGTEGLFQELVPRSN
jgi:glycosyltransferase involved in cell wall biosynthesis